MFSSNIGDFIDGLLDEEREFVKSMQVKVEGMVRFAHKSVLSRTPVHSGYSIRNFVWTVDEPYSGGPVPAVGSMPPGPTNSMPLGMEPRRGVNEARPDASLEALDFKNPFRAFILNNPAETAMQLEFGLLPSPERSRSPAGMTGVTVQALITRLQSGVF